VKLINKIFYQIRKIQVRLNKWPKGSKPIPDSLKIIDSTQQPWTKVWWLKTEIYEFVFSESENRSPICCQFYNNIVVLGVRCAVGKPRLDSLVES